MPNRVYFYSADVHRRIQFVRWTCLFTNLSKFCGAKAGKKMDEKEEIGSSFSTEGIRQLLLTKPSTLALMTTSIVLFLTLVVKRISSTQSEVRVWLKDDGPDDGSGRLGWLAHRPARWRRKIDDGSLHPRFRRRQNCIFVQKHTLIIPIHKRKLSTYV